MSRSGIKDVGIKRWLNSDPERHLHNGHGFERLMRLITKPPEGLAWSPQGIAKEFNVSIKTVYDWKVFLIAEGYLTRDGHVNPTPRAN